MDTFTPPKSVRDAAKQGLELRKKHGRGGTAVGVARARTLSNGQSIPITTISRMVSYFARHEVDKQGEGWGVDSAGYIAWLLWGGDAGKAWANSVWKKHQTQTEKSDMQVTTKAGARHNSQDKTIIKDITSLISQAIDKLEELGVFDEDVEINDEENPNQDLKPGSVVVETGKAISLDQMSDDVRQCFYNQFRSMRDQPYDSPNYQSLYIVSVYADYVIIKHGICFKKVKYTISDEKVVFDDSTKWQKVETEWVTKAVSNLDDIVRSVKAIGDDRLGMYLVLWGDEDRKDLTDEFFTPKTEQMLNVFKAVGKIPTLYHHAADDTIKSDVVGLYDVMVPDDVGIWAEAQLDKASKYKTAITMLTRKGALGSSSGCLPASRVVDKSTGEIKSWTIIEGSLTPSPIEYRQRTEMPVQVLKAMYLQHGLTLPKELNDSGVENTQKSESDDGEVRARMKMKIEAMKIKLGV